MPFNHLMVVSLNHLSGLDEDADQTGYAFTTEDAVNIDAAVCQAALESMYNEANETFALKDYLQEVTIRTALGNTLSLYGLDLHLDGSAHGSPYAVRSWTMGAHEVLDQAPAPAEFAGVVTIYAEGRATAPVETADADADGKRDRPKQRRTGRQYIGPLQGNALQLISNENRLRASYCEDAVVAMARFRNYMLDNAGATLCVWSRKDEVLRPVDSASVDNAPDIQRRRGVASTARVVGSLLAP